MKNSENLNRDVNGTLQTMADGIQYFVIGKNRIRITEHFVEKGKPLDALMVNVIQHAASASVFKCTSCGDEYEGNVKLAFGHNYDVETIEATAPQ